jgi:predicted Rossmann fold nucleotide-binding protein DprA/Smf involved in DNA uptake
MMRNKYIYASSLGTVVVKSDLNKGGTWAGATDNLKMNWTKEFCWNNYLYKGNMELIKNGAIEIDENWDCEFEVLQKKITTKPSEQMSLFDFS